MPILKYGLTKDNAIRELTQLSHDMLASHPDIHDVLFDPEGIDSRITNENGGTEIVVGVQWLAEEPNHGHIDPDSIMVPVINTFHEFRHAEQMQEIGHPTNDPKTVKLAKAAVINQLFPEYYMADYENDPLESDANYAATVQANAYFKSRHPGYHDMPENIAAFQVAMSDSIPDDTPHDVRAVANLFKSQTMCDHPPIAFKDLDVRTACQDIYNNEPDFMQKMAERPYSDFYMELAMHPEHQELFGNMKSRDAQVDLSLALMQEYGHDIDRLGIKALDGKLPTLKSLGYAGPQATGQVREIPELPWDETCTGLQIDDNPESGLSK